ncbi:hypothetical protein EJ05DRAFT_219431 [Pseudovirgaria hyperparasitica]|uniref:Cell wall mannoprotein PIR1-like C-terminal domain-containing protein n=1 Tax=Pseudovirgaria hyperparasitica TaxID=470096 RepID=A0A6A6VUC6_9PEZI|nr:uncharacterized protein EJ05DRAFT_219431 [Pseudovirgaria hyperparasitica]KAF2753499.1 hypothetical protein EJ05DRAFT_219431 [Pseudovirgaria hyperparasitica]
MRSFAVAAFAAVAVALPQGVTEIIEPSGTAPEGCQPTYAGSFNLGVVQVAGDVQKRQLAGTLTVTLADGVLKDQAGRQAYIASNYQFQFDAPPQAGALSTAGYSVCGNQSLALGGTTVFWQCDSGNLINLYDRDWAPQCEPIHLQAQRPAGAPAPGETVINTIVSQIPDGQPQPAPVTQIGDGQPQAPTGPIPVITQISDGQPQAPSAPVITQISDGQPQAPAAPAITQISDGQPQAPPAPVITQISDGQPQAPVITQISDGQPQAPSAPVITQISVVML